MRLGRERHRAGDITHFFLIYIRGARRARYAKNVQWHGGELCIKAVKIYAFSAKNRYLSA